MMHGITAKGVNVTEPVRFGMVQSEHGEHQGREALEKVRLARGFAPIAWWVPARAVLALLQEAVREREGGRREREREKKEREKEREMR